MNEIADQMSDNHYQMVPASIVEQLADRIFPYRTEWEPLRASDLARNVRRENWVDLTPFQIFQMCRMMGFETRKIRGAAAVCVTPSSLIQACQLYNYKDELIERFLTRHKDRLESGQQ